VNISICPKTEDLEVLQRFHLGDQTHHDKEEQIDVSYDFIQNKYYSPSSFLETCN
jgi:hypothetical protein